MLFLINIRLIIAQLEACQENCGAPNRLIGPRHPSTRPHPWKAAVYPSASKTFCKLGCQYWYYNAPNNVTCKASCGHEYRYKVTVGYSDLADEARRECEDGCDIALLLAQAGYYAGNGSMVPCPFGTFREAVHNISTIPGPFNTTDEAIHSSSLLQGVLQCVDCPYGTYRAATKGQNSLSCNKCPIGKYANRTGSTAETDCLRCPAGTTTAEEGARVCICITAASCNMPEPIEQGEATEDYFKDGVDYFRETIPFIGRW